MKIRFPLMLLGLLAAGQAFAQSPTAAALPEWDKLTPAQRETLLAPIRDRWNSEPQAREHMLEHAQRWQRMTPEQRKQARRGVKRFERMNPEQRQQARVLYQHMAELPAEQRKQLQEQWRQMTPEQRRAWIQKNAPDQSPPPPEGKP